MYTAIHTQSEIIFTLSWLNQYFSDSVKHYKHTLKRLLQYIKSTINLDIMYSFSESQVILKYSDFNYTSDKQNQKLILRHIYMLKDRSVL